MFDLGYCPHQSNYARPGYRGTSLQELFSRFPDNGSCARHILQVRFGDDPICRRCKKSATWTLESGKRSFVHSICGVRINPFADTLIHNSHFPATVWFYVMLHLANSFESLSAEFLRRHLGVQLPAARRMLARIRLHLVALDHENTVGEPGGCVYVRVERLSGSYVLHGRRRTPAQIALLACGTKIHVVVLDPARPYRFPRILRERIHQEAEIATDCPYTFRKITRNRRSRSRDIIRTDKIELIESCIWSLRRVFTNQHIVVANHYLWLYLSDYIFRFNRRDDSARIFFDMVSQFPSLRPESVELMRQWHSDAPQPMRR